MRRAKPLKLCFKIKNSPLEKYLIFYVKIMSDEPVENEISEKMEHQPQQILQQSNHEKPESERQPDLEEEKNNEHEPSNPEKELEEEDIQNQLENEKEKAENDSIQEQSDKKNNPAVEQKDIDENAGKNQTGTKKCFNKLCHSKNIFKKIRSRVQQGKYRFLCEPCYENYLSNFYCEFCEQIYSNDTEQADFNKWIGCDNCDRWNHIECEKKYRNKSISEVSEQSTAYLCLGCSQKSRNPTQPNQHTNDYKYRYRAEREYNSDRRNKVKVNFSSEERFPIFHKKAENYSNLECLLQTHNFRLAINDNLIREDLDNLRASRKIDDMDSRPKKKVKTD